jgi:hypothetical protein
MNPAAIVWQTRATGFAIDSRSFQRMACLGRWLGAECKMEILSTNRQIREKIGWVLGNPQDERIVLVAFVGANPLRFLEHPKGIKLYCWLTVPGTSPKGLWALRGEGVELFAVDNLHMKLYWSRKRGAVLGSANLSENALDDGSQFELAVYLPPNTIDAKVIAKKLIATSINKTRIEQFEKEFNLYTLRNPEIPRKRSVTSLTFLEWYKSGGAKWRIFSWRYRYDSVPKDTLTAIKRETGNDYYYDSISSWTKNHYKKGEWVLCFKEKLNANGKSSSSSFSWFIPQIYTPTKAKKWAESKHFWFQIARHLPDLPFNPRDQVFQRAFSKAVDQIGNTDEIMDSDNYPTKQFLRTVVAAYQELESES